MEFRILGPLEVLDGQGIVELGAAKQRALLAVLLLHPNAFVSTSRLVEELWDEHPPATAEKLVQGYVHAVRKRLGAEAVLTQGPGYKLDLDGNSLDLLEFEHLVEEARAAAPSEAIRLRRRALALWRGPPLADVVLDGRAQVALARLEETRLATQLDAIEGELDLGRHADLIGELESLVAADPYQERAHGLLMLALYRSGRQTEALAAYQALRRRLDDDLGLQPSQKLRDLESAILRQDEALDARPPTDVSADVAVPSRAGKRRLGFALALAASIVLAGLVTWATAFRDRTSQVDVQPNSVAVIDPARKRVVDTVPVGIRPGAVEGGGGSIWVAVVEDRTLSWISLRTERVRKNITLPATPTGVAYGAGAVWIAHGLRGQLSRVDAGLAPVVRTRQVTRTVFGTSTGAVAFGFGSVWAAYGDSTLARLDPRTMRRIGAGFAGYRPVGVAVGGGSVWVAHEGEPTVERFNPTTFEEGPVGPPITVGKRPTGIAFGERAVWVSCGGDDTIKRIDPNDGSVTSIQVGDEPSAVAVGQGAVWVANAGDGTVTRIDPVTYAPTSISVGGAPAGIALAGGRVWVSVREP
jgi:DNA-binding SARP family transcriptional activator/DNA-binding beta-propeller fold protein YncE